VVVPDVLLPDFVELLPVLEAVPDPEFFEVPVSFAVPELVVSSSCSLSPLAVALVLSLVLEPFSLSPVWLVVLSFTSDERCDEALLEESSCRATRRGAISRLRASTGLLNMFGHADVVAARSRREERTADGRIAVSTVCGCPGEGSGCSRGWCVWSYGGVECGNWTRGAQMLAGECLHVSGQQVNVEMKASSECSASQ
jgi:hypothetical protein